MRCSRPMSRHVLAAALAAALASPLAALPLQAEPSTTGRAVFEGACAGCHAAGSPRVLAGLPLLARTHAITGSDPSDAIRIVLEGRQPPPEQRGAWMPGFATILSDGQIAKVLDWLRQDADEPPWPGLEQQVKARRR